AHDAVPEAVFHQADLREIPADDGQFALIVCGLALAHVADLCSAITELARVLATGGHLIVSVLPPLPALLGWHVPFAGVLGPLLPPNAGSGARQKAVAKSAGGSAAWFADPGPQAAVDAGLGFCFGEAEVGVGGEELVAGLGGVEFTSGTYRPSACGQVASWWGASTPAWATESSPAPLTVT